MKTIKEHKRTYLAVFDEYLHFYYKKSIYKCNFQLQILYKRKIDSPQFCFDPNTTQDSFQQYGGWHASYYQTHRCYDHAFQTVIYISNVQDRLFQFLPDRVVHLLDIPNFRKDDRNYNRVAVVNNVCYVSDGMQVFEYDHHANKLRPLSSFQSYSTHILRLQNQLIVWDAHRGQFHVMNYNKATEPVHTALASLQNFTLLFTSETAVIGHFVDQNNRPFRLGYLCFIYNKLQFVRCAKKLKRKHFCGFIQNGKWTNVLERYFEKEKFRLGENVASISHLDEIAAISQNIHALQLDIRFWRHYMAKNCISSDLLPGYNQQLLLGMMLHKRQADNIMVCLSNSMYRVISVQVLVDVLLVLGVSDCDVIPNNYFVVQEVQLQPIYDTLTRKGLERCQLGLIRRVSVLNICFFSELLQQAPLTEEQLNFAIFFFADPKYTVYLPELFSKALHLQSVSMLELLHDISPSHVRIHGYSVLQFIIQSALGDKKDQILDMYAHKFKGQTSSFGDSDLIVSAMHYRQACRRFIQQAGARNMKGKGAVHYMLEPTMDKELFWILMDREHDIVLDGGENILFFCILKKVSDDVINQVIARYPEQCNVVTQNGQYASQLYYATHGRVLPQLFQVEKRLIFSMPFVGVERVCQLHDSRFNISYEHRIATMGRAIRDAAVNPGEVDYFGRSSDLLHCINNCYTRNHITNRCDVFGRSERVYQALGRGFQNRYYCHE